MTELISPLQDQFPALLKATLSFPVCSVVFFLTVSILWRIPTLQKNDNTTSDTFQTINVTNLDKQMTFVIQQLALIHEL